MVPTSDLVQEVVHHFLAVAPSILHELLQAGRVVGEHDQAGTASSSLPGSFTSTGGPDPRSPPCQPTSSDVPLQERVLLRVANLLDIVLRRGSGVFISSPKWSVAQKG